MDQRTIDTYNQLATEYDEETTDFWERFPRTFLDEFIRRSGKTVLDVGSGPGRDGLLLQQAGKAVICLDASEAMVRLSSGRGLISVLGDFNALPFADAQFDAVWSYTALLHVPKASAGTALDEVRRVLKPDGMFALGLIEGEGERYRESAGVGMPRLFSYFQKEEAENLCKKHGFELAYFEAFKPGSRTYMNFVFESTLASTVRSQGRLSTP